VTEIELFNPLPATLTHYEQALSHALRDVAGVRVTRVGIERHEGSFAGRLVRQLVTRLVAGRRHGTPLVVLWPSFGLWDPLSWSLATRRRRVLVVIHDPEPLRLQHGYGRVARRVAGLARRGSVTVVAHSAPAQEALRERGWDAVRLPIPLLPTGPMASREGGCVLVLGQHKPTRSLAVLTELSEAAELAGKREVWGRGWPEVAGWDVHNVFLSEAEFREVLCRAQCLVLPYTKFFQSEVTLRALEAGVPVAAARHSFLEELLGPDWPGFVGVDGWAPAVERARQISTERVLALAETARVAAQAAWRSALLGDGADRIGA
jgi:hypothetical protein